jgi:hypothetical protein
MVAWLRVGRIDTSPDAAMRVPKVWRRSWKRTTRTPAR